MNLHTSKAPLSEIPGLKFGILPPMAASFRFCAHSRLPEICNVESLGLMLHALNPSSSSGHPCFAFLAPFGRHLLPSACCLFPCRCGQASLPRRFAILGSSDLLDYPVNPPLRARSLPTPCRAPISHAWAIRQPRIPPPRDTWPNHRSPAPSPSCWSYPSFLPAPPFPVPWHSERSAAPGRSPSPPMFPFSLPRPSEHPATVFRSSRIPLPLLFRQPPMP